MREEGADDNFLSEVSSLLQTSPKCDTTCNNKTPAQYWREVVDVEKESNGALDLDPHLVSEARKIENMCK